MRKMLLEAKEKGHFLCSGRQFGNTVTCINEETRKSPQWNCGCLGRFEGKLPNLNWLLSAACDKIEEERNKIKEKIFKCFFYQNLNIKGQALGDQK